MTDEIELARRAVACDGWRWGRMLTTCGLIVYAHGGYTGYPIGVRLGDTRVRPECRCIPHDALPDLTDPATLGCVLALVRQAWGMPRLVAMPQPDGGWTVWGLTSVASGDTEAAALVTALEAAPVGGA